MHHMASGSAVEEEVSDEAEFSIHCWGCTFEKSPLFGWVVRENYICVLEEGYGNYSPLANCIVSEKIGGGGNLRIQWFSHIYGKP